jgi:arylsulfatase A-like enzyme
MFTGLYPGEHTATEMDSVLPAGIPTLAERLQQAGYETWGFSNNPLVGVAPNELTRGIGTMRNYSYLGAGLLTYRLNAVGRPLSWHDRLTRSGKYMLAEMLGYSQDTGLGLLAPLVRPLWQSYLRRRGAAKQMNAARSLADAATALAHASEKPVFTFVNLMGAHVPYDPPQWAIERFLGPTLGRRTTLRLLQYVNRLQVDAAHWLNMTLPKAEFEAAMDGFYDAETAAQDALIGQFVDRLRESGALDKTLLIIVADHGDHLGDKGRLNHTFGAYQALAHVPLIIRDPENRLPRGQSVATPLSTRRLFHTLLSAAGAADAQEEALSLFRGAEESRPVVTEALPIRYAVERLEKKRPGLAAAHGYGPGVRALFAGDLKLVAGGGQQELYDIAQDPRETRDLSPAGHASLSRLRAALDRFVSESEPHGGPSQHGDTDPELLRRLRELGYVE